MTNEEKIRELSRKHQGTMTDAQYLQMLYALEEMAEWKDQQFAEEKKELIDKAADYIYTHAHVSTFGDIRLDKCSMTHFVEDFKKAMEE